MNNLYDGLAEVLLILLKSQDTRENVLKYLAEVININASRAHIQVNFFLICIFLVEVQWHSKQDNLYSIASFLFYFIFLFCIPCHNVHAEVF